MSSKGGSKTAEARRALPATGEYADVEMKNGEVCKDALQQSGKEMAEGRRALPATGEYADVVMKNGEVCKDALQQSGKKLGDEYGAKGAEARRAQPATGEYADAPLTGGGTVGNDLQAAGKKLSVEYGSLGTRRTKPWVSVRASRIMNGEDHEFAVFDGSFLTTVNNKVASAKVLIQKTGNKENYMKMLDKYDEDKQEFKNPVDLPAFTLRLSFVTETKLEDIVKSLAVAFVTETKLEEIVNSLADCAPNKPVPVVRRSKGGNALAPDQAINWKFEVIGYLPAETRNAEMMAAAAEGAKIH
jgi:hypothetical protein